MSAIDVKFRVPGKSENTKLKVISIQMTEEQLRSALLDTFASMITDPLTMRAPDHNVSRADALKFVAKATSKLKDAKRRLRRVDRHDYVNDALEACKSYAYFAKQLP